MNNANFQCSQRLEGSVMVNINRLGSVGMVNSSLEKSVEVFCTNFIDLIIMCSMCPLCLELRLLCQPLLTSPV